MHSHCIDLARKLVTITCIDFKNKRVTSTENDYENLITSQSNSNFTSKTYITLSIKDGIRILHR